MPNFLEKKLKAEYGDNPHAVYGTMNAIGAMHGNQITAKGKRMEAQHARDMKRRSMGHHAQHGTLRALGGKQR